MITIAPTLLGDPDLDRLIETHRAFCRAHTPHGSGHAVTPDGARDDGVRYWIAREDGQALGCIGVRELTPTHVEIKTLHVLDAARGRGIGVRLVEEALADALAKGVQRVSLETGSSDGFAPSRALYSRMGFEPCEPFGSYVNDPFSYCMTRTDVR